MKIHLFNIALFQMGWFICVVMGNAAAILYTAAALLIHKHWIVARPSEWKVIALVACLGCSWDTLMGLTGVLIFSGSAVLPLWLICLWLLFSTTLLHSLFWMRNHLLLTALAGAIFGPLSYWLGAKLNSQTSIGDPEIKALIIISLGWSLILPVVFKIAKRVLASDAKSD